VPLEIRPEPRDAERRAIAAALAELDGAPAAYTSGWSASALDDLRDGPPAEEPWGAAGVVEA
jgi:hypothetical protein